jgi:2-aminoadipate transaminase
MASTSTDWSRLVARRTLRLKPSALRQLLKLTARPGMISFAGGLPAAELFPLDRVAEAAAAALKRTGGAALQYGETEGIAPLREWIARRYSTPAMALKPENVLITAGSQQVLDLVGRVFLDPRDRVLVENPTYLAALQAWRAYGASFLAATLDADGVDLDDFDRQLKKRPKMAYLMPNFHNPTGVTLAGDRRRQLMGLLPVGGLVLVEDNPYEELRYEGSPLPGLLELGHPPDAGGCVVRAGTFSKTLMPGLRLGWAIGPKEVIAQMAKTKQAVDLHTSTFNQYLALELLAAGYLEESLPALRTEYRRRRDTMLAALKEHLPPGCQWIKPEGGMFIFVTLPRRISAATLLPQAIARNVAFVPGQDFHLGGRGGNTLRLNFTKTPAPEIAEGIRRLGEVIKASR